MASTKVDTILEVYKDLSKYPVLISAEIIPSIKDGIKVESIWSQRNLEKRKKQNFVRDFTFDANLELVAESFPSDTTSEVLKVSSNDNSVKAILRDVTFDGKCKQFIEIWGNQHLVKSYDLSAFDVHGDVYSDPTFSAFELSPDNKRLLYIAEKKLKKSDPFYTQKAKNKNKTFENEEKPIRGAEYIFKPNWGEQLVNKHRSVVVVLNIIEDTIVPLDSIPDDYFPGQVIWAPNGIDVVGVVHKLHVRYLGLKFCTNRESYIFHLKDTVFRILSAEKISCRSPRFSGDGNYLIWLERNISVAHDHVQRLMYLKWNTLESPAILIDTVQDTMIISKNKKFYGLYIQRLPKRCWSNDFKYVFFSTPQQSTVKSYMINLDTKLITEIDNPENTSLIILDVNKNYIVFSKVTPTQPPRLAIGTFNSQSVNIDKLSLKSFTTPLSNIDKYNLMYENVQYVYDNNDSVKDFNFTYLGKKTELKKSTPLIVIAHGGPQSVFSNQFKLSHAVFASLGFGVLLINYRGSLGMGGNNVEYLLGKIGNSDIFDCVTAINFAMKKYPWLDPKRISLFSGSHGGFINAHLSGRYPEMFKTVIMRNPVIDVATMFSTTDIPDWCPGEIGVAAFGTLPENIPEFNYSELIQKLLSCSPILHADNVKAPTLIALGSNDLRVPSAQGKLWYYRLSTNNISTKLYLYDDNHSLLKDEVEIDFIINSVLWIYEHDK